MNPELVFRNFLTQEKLENSKFLLMVSGGIDSMVLLDIAYKTCKKEHLYVFHLDHGFRETSALDADFVKTICEELNIPCTTEVLSKTPDKNTEAHWRKQRKELSQACAETYECDRILTAHHATDLVETMIFRITKGCGPQGLSPFDLSTKPLASISKKDIEHYAKEHNIKWKEDASNNDTTFERNRIRHEVLPVLRSINPNLEQTFWKEQELFSQVQEHTDSLVGDIMKQDEMTREAFLDLSSYIQQAFVHSLGAGSTNEVKDCLRWIHTSTQGGTEKKLSHYTLGIKQNILSWYKN